MEKVNALAPLMHQEDDPEYLLSGCLNYLTPHADFMQEAMEEQINDAWRQKIAEWCFEIIDHFDLNREAASIALNYADRFMTFSHRNDSNTRMVTKRAYKLLVLTSTYLAIKLHGMPSSPSGSRRNALLSVNVFVELSRNTFTASNISQMELKLLNTLKWKVNPPLPATFVQTLLELLPDWHVEDGSGTNSFLLVKSAIHEMARFLTEIAVCVSDFTFLFKPSVIGYASILAAMHSLEHNPSISIIFPPYEVHVQFFHNVFSTTWMSPDSDDIENARSRLMDACPEAFQHITASVSHHTAVLDAHDCQTGRNNAVHSPTGIDDLYDASGNLASSST